MSVTRKLSVLRKNEVCALFSLAICVFIILFNNPYQTASPKSGKNIDSGAGSENLRNEEQADKRIEDKVDENADAESDDAKSQDEDFIDLDQDDDQQRMAEDKIEKVIDYSHNEIKLAFAICNKPEDMKEEKTLKTDLTRQVVQSLVLLKSAAALTFSPIRIFAILEPINLIDIIMDGVNSWPREFKKRLIFETRNLPDGKCKLTKLHIQQILPELDAVIYLDTDFIFMRPPQELWALFSKFNDEQFMGLAPSLSYYNSNDVKIPFYGTTGLSVGVILVNITRVNRLPWVEKGLQKESEYQNDIKYDDQDVLNILFSETPNAVYVLDCTWNFRKSICTAEENPCQDSLKYAVSLLHGSLLAFHDNKDSKIKTIYDSWRDYNPKDNLDVLFKSMQLNLKKHKTDKSESCSGIENIDRVLTYGLETFIYNGDTANQERL